MQRPATATAYSRIVGAAAALNTLSGLWMFWIDSGGLHTAWLSTSTGFALALGGAAGLAAAAI